MQAIRVFGIGLILSWLVVQVITIPFVEYYINSSNYAFLVGWDNATAKGNLVSQLNMLFSIWFISLGIGMIFSMIIEYFINIFIFSTTISKKIRTQF